MREIVCEYPIGHKRRRKEGMPVLVEKFRTNLARRFPVRSSGIAQVRDWIALQAVRPALKNDELRFELFYVRHHLRPCLIEGRVV